MLLPIHENQRAASDVGEAIIKTISSRVAGGRIELSTDAARVRPSYQHSLVPFALMLL
jgi:DNA excision repair protein ERCC-4